MSDYVVVDPISANQVVVQVLSVGERGQTGPAADPALLNAAVSEASGSAGVATAQAGIATTQAGVAAAASAAAAADRALSQAAAASAAQDARFDDVPALLADALPHPPGTTLATKNGAAVEVVTSGAQATTAGLVLVKERELYVPYLEQTTKAAGLLPWAMRDDVLSGAMALDHTAALLSIFTDANLRRCLEFPAGGIFGISQLLIPPTTKAREIIMHGATIRGRAVKQAGNFVQFLAPGNAYGLWDDLKMEGGTIDQAAAQIGGKLFRTLFLRRASFSHMTVKHRTAVRRYVTLNNTTDVFTISSGTNPWQNGDFVALETDLENQAGGHPGSGTRLYVINRTETTLQLSLTDGGASINWTSNGAGLFVFDYGAWGWAFGGRKLLFNNCAIENGSEPYQDGFHAMHGREIAMAACRSDAGDDAIALGSEETIETEGIEDVSVAGFIGNSKTAYIVGIYAAENYGARKIKNVEIRGIVGTAGTLRNGAFKVRDYGDIGSRENPVIDGVKISGIVTVSSADRTSLTSRQIARVWGAANVGIKSQIRVLGALDFAASDIQRSRDVEIDLDVTEGSLRTASIRTTTSRIVEVVNDARNKIPNHKYLTGMVPGVHGTSEGKPPAGWSNDTTSVGGTYRKSIFAAGVRPEGAIMGLRFTGVVGAGTYDVTIPIGPDTRTAFTEAKIPCLIGQKATARIMLAMTGALPAGVSMSMTIKERTLAGAFVGSSFDALTPGSEFLQHTVRSYTCVGDGVIGLSLQLAIPASTDMGDFALLICDPQLILA